MPGSWPSIILHYLQNCLMSTEWMNEYECHIWGKWFYLYNQQPSKEASSSPFTHEGIKAQNWADSRSPGKKGRVKVWTQVSGCDFNSSSYQLQCLRSCYKAPIKGKALKDTLEFAKCYQPHHLHGSLVCNKNSKSACWIEHMSQEGQKQKLHKIWDNLCLPPNPDQGNVLLLWVTKTAVFSLLLGGGRRNVVFLCV